MVVLLCTKNKNKGVESSSEIKFEENQFCDYTKGGVDTMDKTVRYFSAKRMISRWS